MVAPALVQVGTRAVALAADPAIRAKVAAYASKALGKVVPADASALTRIASSGPAGAAIVVRGAAGAGIDPDAMFAGLLNEQKNGAMARIYNDTKAKFAAVTAVLDSVAKLHPTGDVAERIVRKRLIMWASEKFGSSHNIREAHAMFRQFLELDTAALEEEITLHLITR